MLLKRTTIKQFYSDHTHLISRITVKIFYYSTLEQHRCKLPENGNCAELFWSKLIAQYTCIIYRTVHLLVLAEFVNQFRMHGMNNMKVYTII